MRGISWLAENWLALKKESPAWSEYYPCYSLTHGIYNYIPQTSHVPTLYTVAAVLYLQSVLHVMLFHPLQYVLYLYISTSCSLCAVPNMAVVCSSLISCFPGVLLRCFLYEIIIIIIIIIIDWSTALQSGRSLVLFPMLSMEFLIAIILLAALRNWGGCSRNEYQKYFLGVKAAGA